MDIPIKPGKYSPPRAVVIGGSVVGVLTVVAVLVVWVLVPWLVDRAVADQFEYLEERTGLEVHVESVELSGWDKAIIEGLEVSWPDDTRSVATVDSTAVTVDPLSAIGGRPTISEVEIQGADGSLKRYADGSTDLHRVYDNFIDDDAPEQDQVDEQRDLDEVVGRVLRHFGGQFPRVALREAQLELTHADGADPWAVRQVRTDELLLDGGADEADVGTQLELTSTNDPNISIPERVDVAGTVRRPVTRSNLAVEMEPQLQVADLEQLPFARLGVSGLEITDDYAVQITDVAVSSTLPGTSNQLVEAERIRVQFERWPSSLSNFALREVEVDSPQIRAQFDANGGSNFHDLYAVAHQPTANSVASNARVVSDAVAAAGDESEEEEQPEAQGDDDAGDAEPDEVEESAGFAERLDELPLADWLFDYLPPRTEIHELQILIDDAREHDKLTRPAEQLEVNAERLKLEHDTAQGVLEGDIQLETHTDDHSGSADVQFHVPYRSGRWDASVDVDDLELAHFAQMGGPAVARYLRGGTIDARLDVEHGVDGQDTRTRFDGSFDVEQLRGEVDAVADDTVQIDSAGLEFGGFYDGQMQLPDPELVEEEDLEEFADSDDAQQAPTEGGLVVQRATARLADVEAQLDVGVYGVDGLRLPNRLVLGVELEETDLQDIVDAVPPAIQGPLEGLVLHGSIGWDFELEVPLYHASDMVWESDVDLSPDLDVSFIPEEVNVFSLTGEFTHTIEDEWTDHLGRNFYYERTVDIPEMRPIPAEWLVENTGLSLEQIDQRRRLRGWPPIPAGSAAMEVDSQQLREPEFWLSDVANRDVADVPWSQRDEQTGDDDALGMLSGLAGDGDGTSPQDSSPREVLEYGEPYLSSENGLRINPNRYGPYVYVPLHHISPYMVRAIMTTEDNSFFSHSGFNYLAIRQSVEQNLDAGRYVRGASTISMQLARNLFLGRDQVLARKLQEVVLVWLMENVADIPKPRMMELYLNIIEYGPGIYGIHEAAVHYFGKRPDELTVEECAWLTSIVPSPKRRHSHYDRGEISPHWFNVMSRYIRAMEARDRITESELEEATDEPPTFHIPSPGEPALRADAEPVEPREDADAPEADDGQQLEPLRLDDLE